MLIYILLPHNDDKPSVKFQTAQISTSLQFHISVITISWNLENIKSLQSGCNWIMPTLDKENNVICFKYVEIVTLEYIIINNGSSKWA